MAGRNFVRYSGSHMVGSSRRTLGIVFFTIFLDLMGFGIIIPIQPFFAETLGASPAVVTLLGASFSLMQFLFSPFWGKVSDKVGRRPVLLMSVCVTAVGYLIFGFAKSLEVLFFARMLAGLGSANIGTAQAIIADSTTPETRAKGMGLIGAAFGLGFIFGPAIGGFFGQFGLATPAFIAAGLCAVNFFSAYLYLPETHHPGDRPSETSHFALSWKAIRHAARHPNIPQLFLLYFFWTSAFSLMEQVLGMFIEVTWLRGEGRFPSAMHAREAAALTAWVLICVGVTATVVQGGLIGKLARRFGERRLLSTGTCLAGLCLFAIPFVGMLKIFALLMAVSVLLAVGTGITNPSLSSLLSQSAARNEQGTTLGIGQSLGGLGRVFGPAMAGSLFQIYHGLPFWVGAVLMFLCSAITLSIPRPRLNM